MTYFYLVLAALTVIFGDIFAKKWSELQSASLATLSLLGYFFSSVFFLCVMVREKNLIIASTLWVIMATIGYILVGLYYGETLKVWQWIGIALGIISVVILSLR